MMRLCPKARSDLFPIMAARFPFWKWSKEHLTWYCVQSFQVLDYLPSIRKQLLELVIDKCLEIDVNIKIKNNGEVLIEEEQKEDVLLEGGLDGKVKKPQKEHAIVDDIDELSDKLDSLLALLLETIRQESNDGVGVRALYYELLPVFESIILTTHKSKFVQYCVFLLCGLESQMVDDGNVAVPSTDHHQQQQHAILHRDFAAKLLETIVDPYRATLTRQSGACYLASFISRASYVGPETVCESVSALLRWAEAYMDSLATDSIRAADAREQSDHHSLFYTVCQAAFYIMCFRGTEAIQFHREAMTGYSTMKVPTDGEEFYWPDPAHVDLSTERWTTICNHELQPLRFCLESVRSEFLHVAHAFNLVEEQILDKLVVDAKRLSTGRVNKKAASICTAATLEKRRQSGGVGGLGRGSNPLKSFFPFDPLLLRRSHEYINSFYKHWQGPVEEEDVLVIDDLPEGDDPIFEMDENIDASDDEDDVSDDDDEVPVVVSDQETRDDDDSDAEENPRTPDTLKKREMQRKAWTETTKRPRSQSLENGSW
jgi:RNA polymerase I-specific transcription initiation factor RRN3